MLQSEKVASGTKVVLMSTDSKSNLIFTKDDQASIRSAVDSSIKKLASDGITDLRLPTLEELQYVKNNIDEVNSNLEKAGEERFLINSPTIYTYYFKTESGDVNIYCPYRNDVESSFNSDRASQLLRAFAIMVFAD